MNVNHGIRRTIAVNKLLDLGSDTTLNEKLTTKKSNSDLAAEYKYLRRIGVSLGFDKEEGSENLKKLFTDNEQAYFLAIKFSSDSHKTESDSPRITTQTVLKAINAMKHAVAYVYLDSIEALNPTAKGQELNDAELTSLSSDVEKITSYLQENSNISSIKSEDFQFIKPKKFHDQRLDEFKLILVADKDVLAKDAEALAKLAKDAESNDKYLLPCVAKYFSAATTIEVFAKAWNKRHPRLPTQIPHSLLSQPIKTEEFIIGNDKYVFQNVSGAGNSCGFHVLGKERKQAVNELIDFITVKDVFDARYKMIARALLVEKLNDQSQLLLRNQNPSANSAAEREQIGARLSEIQTDDYFVNNKSKDGIQKELISYLEDSWLNTNNMIDCSGFTLDNSETGKGLFTAFSALYRHQINVYRDNSDREGFFQATPPGFKEGSDKVIHIYHGGPTGGGHYQRLIPSGPAIPQEAKP